MLSLRIEAEGEAPRSVRIERFPARIGRHAENTVQLASWRVARVHAEILRVDHGFKLVDRGSLGGTWVNGERIVEHSPLDADDEISIAGYRVRIESGATPDSDHSVAASGAVAATSVSQLAAQRPERVDESLVYWRRMLHRRLLATIDLRRQEIRQLSPKQLRDEIETLLHELARDDLTLPPDIDRDRLACEVVDEAIGLGPLEALLRDDTVTEIMVNAPDEIFVERAGKLERTRASFTGEDAVRAAIDRIVAPLGRRIDESSPMVDARLADGSRVNAIIPPLAVRGPALTIRRFNHRLFSPDDLVANGSLSRPMLDFLAVCVRSRRNLVVSGGTGSGKTTLLNLLSNLIDPCERVVTIEDAAELRLAHVHRVTLEARPANAEGRGLVTIRDLVRNALRMRPDRIVVGECRSGEALDMLQAMNTGHDGSLTTVHANSPRDVVSRLETMVLMADLEMPVAAIREQIAAAIEIVIQQARMADGTRRVVEIVELTGLEGVRVSMQPLFRFAAGRFSACGNVPQFYERLRAEGEALDLSIFRDS